MTSIYYKTDISETKSKNHMVEIIIFIVMKQKKVAKHQPSLEECLIEAGTGAGERCRQHQGLQGTQGKSRTAASFRSGNQQLSEEPLEIQMINVYWKH